MNTFIIHMLCLIEIRRVFADGIVANIIQEAVIENQAVLDITALATLAPNKNSPKDLFLPGGGQNARLFRVCLSQMFLCHRGVLGFLQDILHLTCA